MMAVVIVSAAVIVLSHVYFGLKNIVTPEMFLQLTEEDHYLQINSEIDSMLLEIDDYIQQFKLTFQDLKTSKPIYVFLMNDYNMVTPFAKKQIALKEKIAEYNSLLIKYSKLYSNFYAFDLNEFLLNNCNNQIIDYKYYYSSKSFLNSFCCTKFCIYVEIASEKAGIFFIA